MSDAQLQKRVFEYAGELSGGLNLTPHPISVGVWYSKLPDGSTINVRSVSTSGTGRWTIDIQENTKLGIVRPSYRENRYELKFK